MLSNFEADNYNLRLIRQNVTDEAIAGQPRPDQLLVELVANGDVHRDASRRPNYAIDLM